MPVGPGHTCRASPSVERTVRVPRGRPWGRAEHVLGTPRQPGPCKAEEVGTLILLEGESGARVATRGPPCPALCSSRSLSRVNRAVTILSCFISEALGS